MPNLEFSTHSTPKLYFDLNNGVIKITGRSTMLNPQEFYPSVIHLIEEYCENPHQHTKLVIDLGYYNSMSSRFLLRIVELISRLDLKRNHTVKINWFYDPEDLGIAEDIRLFSKIIHYRINAVAYELA